jgi:hypothetical protein
MAQAATITHTTNKNDKKEVVDYTIVIDSAPVGKATKTDKGKFNFAPAWPEGKPLADIKTMRDLKVEVSKACPKDFVSANKPAPKTETKKAPAASGNASPKTGGKKAVKPAAEEPAGAEDQAAGPTEGDIELD